VFESKIPGALLADGSNGYDYIYKVTDVQAKPWDIQFAYSDTGSDIASSVHVTAHVSVYAETTCSVALACQIPLGESRSISSDSCTKIGGTCSSGQNILEDLARRPAK
jgi:hypothetical protein